MVTLVSLLPSAAVVAVYNGHGVDVDGTWYLMVAQALVRGRGYLWPWNSVDPTAWHPPLWPFLESIFLRCFPSANPLSVVHASELIVHGATVLGAVLLARMLSASWGAMLCAGLSVSLWPGALSLIVEGHSETCAAAALVLGTALICQGGKRFWGGALVLSAVPMVRPDFLALPLCAFVFWLLLRFSSPHRNVPEKPARLAVAILIFYLPSAAWVIRNYRAMGAFPVFATADGDVLSGSYNPAVATMGRRFALWVLPGQRGEAVQPALRPEVEGNRQDRERAMQFVRAHWQVVPAVMLGHWIRALLPEESESVIPALRRVEWIGRLGLYAAIITLSVVLKPPPFPAWYRLLLGAAALTTAVTVTFFYFDQRFMYPLTVLLLTAAAAGVGARKRTALAHATY